MSSIDLNVLTKPFPKDQIRTRRIPGGELLHQPTNHAVVTRLNEAFSGAWSFRIRSWWKEEEEVIVLAQLSAGGQVKHQFGSSSLTRGTEAASPFSIGDDLKAAALDALNNCAAGFGVALELHGAPPQALRPGATGKKERAAIPPLARRTTPIDRLLKAHGEMLKLPGGAGLFTGVLDLHGVERMEDLPEDQVAHVLARCESVYRTSRNGRSST